MINLSAKDNLSRINLGMLQNVNIPKYEIEIDWSKREQSFNCLLHSITNNKDKKEIKSVQVLGKI
jgi:hypothetical protein